jgi:hypothetical protein
VSRRFESIYTLQEKNLINTSYAWPPRSHVRQPLAKSLPNQNQISAPGMKSWLPAMPGLAVILGGLILPPTNHLEVGRDSSTK